MYGDIASKLVQEARRAQNLDTLPAFATELIQGIIREVNEIDAESGELVAEYERVEEILAERASQGIIDDIDDDETLRSFGLNSSEITPDKKRQLTCAMVVLRLCLLRNKRCLIAYQKLRADAIDKLAWAEADPQDPKITYNMAPAEQAYFQNYSDLVVTLKGAYSEIDITGSLEPPKDLFVDVRVLKDAGEIQTEYGVFNLTKNSQYYVRHADVHRLIQQGYLQRLS